VLFHTRANLLVKQTQCMDIKENLQEENTELHSQVEWHNYFIDYVYKVNRNLYNDACQYADKKQKT